jgi:hypothetical protein
VGTLANIVNLAAYLGIFIAVLIIAYAGFLWVLNPISPENRSQARQILINAAIGLVLTLGAWLLVNTLITLLGAQLNGQTGVAGLTSELSKNANATCEQIVDHGNKAPVAPPPGGGLSGGPENGGNGGNASKEIQTLDQNAEEGKNKGNCGVAVREALCAGGNDYYCSGHGNAYQLGQTLDSHGFNQVSADGYTPQAGDVAVFDPYGSHIYGHIEMYDGTQWVSYFKQGGDTPYGTGFYANHSGYQNDHFTIWRGG